MAQFANIELNQPKDGWPYSQAVPLTSNEADLTSLAGVFLPLPVNYGQTFFATVLLSAQGNIGSQTAYVVAQTCCDNINWIDVAWIKTTISTGTQLFALSSAVSGANAIQQTRAANSAPASNGSVTIPLGGSLRFVGAAPGLGSSSSASGSFNALLATIYVKILGLR